ncbi:MAG: hypothetical protein L0Z62_50440 [Gemmataceae bacterium]|nr:hypothetical protein [Gemmataceae bacterium]
MLARLDQVAGVERSLANSTGTLIWLVHRSGADPEQVAEEARRVLDEETYAGGAVRLSADESAEAVQAEEWRDLTRIGELSVIEARTLGLRAALALAAVLGALGTWIAWRRRKAARQRA